MWMMSFYSGRNCCCRFVLVETGMCNFQGKFSLWMFTVCTNFTGFVYLLHLIWTIVLVYFPGKEKNRKCQGNVHGRVFQDLWVLEMLSNISVFWFQCLGLGGRSSSSEHGVWKSTQLHYKSVEIKWQIFPCLEF